VITQEQLGKQGNTGVSQHILTGPELRLENTVRPKGFELNMQKMLNTLSAFYKSVKVIGADRARNLDAYRVENAPVAVKIC
jgi:hypothetical protein